MVPRHRHIGEVKRVELGSASVLLRDGRRVRITPREIKASGLKFQPGDAIALSVFRRTDTAFVGFDLARC